MNGPNRKSNLPVAPNNGLTIGEKKHTFLYLRKGGQSKGSQFTRIDKRGKPGETLKRCSWWQLVRKGREEMVEVVAKTILLLN
jgi:hypothetical protein